MQLYIQKLEANQAIRYSDSILQIIDDKKWSTCEKTFWILLERGEAMELNNFYEEALSINYNIARQAETNKWWSILAQTHISIARCFERIGRSGDCFLYLNKAREIITEHRLDTVYATYCLRYSSYHRIYDSQDSAKLYALKSIESGKKYGVDRSVFDGHLLMGILSTDLDTAIFHFQQAVNIFSERGDFNGAASQSANIASRLMLENRNKEAWQAIHQAESYLSKAEGKSKNYFRILSKIQHQRQSLFEVEGRQDSAYHYLKLATENESKAQSYVNQEKITQNAVGFAIEKEKEKVKYEQKISYILRIGIAALGFLFLLLSLVLYNNKKKQKQIELQNQTIITNNDSLNKVNQKQAVLLSEIHHRVKNNLQVIISLLALEGTKSRNPEVKSLLEDIGSKVKSIALIHDQLYSSGDFEKINLKSYLIELCTHFKEFQSENYNFDFEIDCEDIHLNLETVFPLGIICTELIANSLKYGEVKDQKLKLDINLKQINNKYVLRYNDNGPGYKNLHEGAQTQKMGLNIIQNMVRQLQGESSRYNDHGAVFSILFEEKLVSLI
jgi:two-component sensor histidine kinase